MPVDQHFPANAREPDLDEYSELAPEDSVSQVGRNNSTRDPAPPPRYSSDPVEGLAPHLVSTLDPRPGSSSPRLVRNSQEWQFPSHSRRGSAGVARAMLPAVTVPSSQNTTQYTWQSIQEAHTGRPRIHVIKIVSSAATSASGLPGGEALRFAISPEGQRIACYNSVRLFILQSAALPDNVSQEYALKRRPLAVELVDDGSVVAILADEHTVNAYDLSNHRVRRLRTIRLDLPATSIALSPSGALLAAAYENAVEVFSLDPNGLSTDRRAARCPGVDRLQFSKDGSTLVGTTIRPDDAATVVISVPLFPAADDGLPTHEELKAAWCGGILEPINISDTSHATFLLEQGTTSNESLFAWNGTERIFGVLNVHDLEYNNVEFPLAPVFSLGGLGAAVRSIPAFDEEGANVAMIINDRTARLYSVPESGGNEDEVVEALCSDFELEDLFGCPFTDLRWVRRLAGSDLRAAASSGVFGRLLMVSPGAVHDEAAGDASMDENEGGRIIVLDFDDQHVGQPGCVLTFTLGKAPPQTLDEADVDEAQQVALIRQRTVSARYSMHKRAPTLTRPRSALRRLRPISQPTDPVWEDDLGSPHESPVDREFSGHDPDFGLSRSWDILPGLTEMEELFEAPYDGNNPRSRASLRRAASAASTHRLQTFQERRAQMVTGNSDDVAQLPPYTEEANSTLPARYRILAGLDRPYTMHRSFSAPSTINELPDYSDHGSNSVVARIRPSSQVVPRSNSSGAILATQSTPALPLNLPRSATRARVGRFSSPSLTRLMTGSIRRAENAPEVVIASPVAPEVVTTHPYTSRASAAPMRPAGRRLTKPSDRRIMSGRTRRSLWQVFASKKSGTDDSRRCIVM